MAGMHCRTPKDLCLQLAEMLGEGAPFVWVSGFGGHRLAITVGKESSGGHRMLSDVAQLHSKP